MDAAVLLLITVTIPVCLAGHAWNYDVKSHSGPHHWEYNCGGSQQSPVSLPSSGPDTFLPPLVMEHYDKAPEVAVLRNNGHTAKHRKQNMRAKMPHLPSKINTALPTSLAINHFDQFYGSVYKEARWGSMRLGLLSKQKYAVLVNNFGDSEATIEMLEEMGCVDINKQFNIAQQGQEQYVRDIETIVDKKHKDDDDPETPPLQHVTSSPHSTNQDTD